MNTYGAVLIPILLVIFGLFFVGLVGEGIVHSVNKFRGRYCGCSIFFGIIGYI